MKLIVDKPKFSYGGKRYAVGQQFEATLAHGRLLILVRAAHEAPREGYERADLAPQIASGPMPTTTEYARADLEPVKRKRGRPRKIRENADA